jgi:hypothetical protein
VLPNHLATILAAALPLASQPEEREHRAPAAAAAAQAVALAAGEEGLPLLVGEVVKACEESGRAAGAAALVEGLARAGRLPLVDYADELLKVGSWKGGRGAGRRPGLQRLLGLHGVWMPDAWYHEGAVLCGAMLWYSACMAACSQGANDG